MTTTPVLLIGIDGATFNPLNPFPESVDSDPIWHLTPASQEGAHILDLALGATPNPRRRRRLK